MFAFLQHIDLDFNSRKLYILKEWLYGLTEEEIGIVAEVYAVQAIGSF